MPLPQEPARTPLSPPEERLSPPPPSDSAAPSPSPLTEVDVSSPPAAEPPAPTSTPAASASATATTAAPDAVGQLLAFLSTASAEVLAAIFAGVSLALYVVLGRLGLLVVGVVIGAVGHASLSLLASRRDGASFLHLLPKHHRDEPTTTNGVGALAKKPTPRRADFSSLPPETAKAMEELTDAVIRDYVRWWYSPLLPQDDNFPGSCRNVLVGALLSLHAHLSQKRSADTFMLFLVSTTNTLIVFLRELATTSQSSVDTYVEESPASALAQMVDRDIQKRRLRMAADDIVQSFFGKEVLECEPVRIFLTEILGGVVLEMTVDKCANPDWINEWIVYLLEEETQPEILQKIDIGEATAAANGTDAEVVEKPKRLSRAEEEMKRAMEEAQEMTRMIQEEEEQKRKSVEEQKRNSLEASPKNSMESRDSLENIKLPPPPSALDDQDDQPAPAPAPTSFEQLVPPTPPVPSSPPSPQDALHRAIITLSDLTPPTATSPTYPEKNLRSKPSSAMYLLQIEPSSPSIPGWIVTRKYVDFETLHEVLRRISTISGLDAFRTKHPDVPTWRGQTSNSLRSNLERYLNDALRERELAESEGMKRFLEKLNGMNNIASNSRASGAFAALGKGWPNPAAFAKMGEGVLDALAKAPKGVAEGGKGLFGGMTRALSVGPKNSENNAAVAAAAAQHRERATLSRRSSLGSSFRERLSGESSRTVSPLPRAQTQPVPIEESQPQLPPRSQPPTQTQTQMLQPPPRPRSNTDNLRPSHPPRSVSRDNYIQLELPPGDGDDASSVVSLPPPPSDMPDDFDSEPLPPLPSIPSSNSNSNLNLSSSNNSSRPSPALNHRHSSPVLPPPSSSSTTTTTGPTSAASTAQSTPSTPPASARADSEQKRSSPLSTAETQFIVEILFALLGELYTLSSAWLLRRSLLNVAKSILLRPGNASLEDIRVLLQETVIDSNTADSAIAGYVRKLRENCFPTDEERKGWETLPQGPKGEELRRRARRLFCAKGVPEAIRGVMGAYASEEALGKVFDAVQRESVGRGVVGGLVLEGVRGVCQ